MTKEPLYPHIPGKREPLYPHVTKGRQPATIPVGISLPEEGIYKPGDVFKTPQGEARLDFYSRYERNWVVTYEPEGKQVRLDVATMDKLVDSREWVYQLKEVDIDLLAATEGDPLRKFCCRICGECAPKELLEEGRFPDRIAWLRSHYASVHPGMWGKMTPMTVEDGEMVSPEYRHLANLVSEPLPKDAY